MGLRHLARAGAVAASGLVIGLAATIAGHAADSADDRETVNPVYPLNAADPGAVQDGKDFYVFSTGALTWAYQAPDEQGPWTQTGHGLTRRPDWGTFDGMWAPDVVQVSGDKWLMYYAVRVNGLAPNQRCIGMAISETGPGGPYDPGDLPPLSCPEGATWPDGITPLVANDQPPAHEDQAGFIDPVPFQASDGKRYVIFKKQRPPITTLRIVEVEADWMTPVAPSKPILTRTDGQIENAVMVERAGKFYLFMSYDDWYNCSYRTTYLISDSPTSGWSFYDGYPEAPSDRGGILMQNSDGTYCGPGGADMVVKGADATDSTVQMFFHGWICDVATTRPCANSEEAEASNSKIRALYSAKVAWNSDDEPFVLMYEKPKT